MKMRKIFPTTPLLHQFLQIHHRTTSVLTGRSSRIRFWVLNQRAMMWQSRSLKLKIAFEHSVPVSGIHGAWGNLRHLLFGWMLKNGVLVQLRINTPFVLYQLNIAWLHITRYIHRDWIFANTTFKIRHSIPSIYKFPIIDKPFTLATHTTVSLAILK